mmetsp:Transcript_4893/g.7242  ORF Transcript_4893/g.7242 Transcript_4893/m.7242 type:complete len:534 (+) Transcript_4893:107-1708(+)
MANLDKTRENHSAPPQTDYFMIICYAIFNFGMSMSMMYVMSFMMPKQIEHMVGSVHASGVLGIIIGLASIGNAIASIIVGLIADRFGGHFVLIFLGILIWCASIISRNAFAIVKAPAVSVVMYGLISSLGKMAYAFIEAPYTGLLPINFHETDYGKVTGGTGLTLILGSAFGVAGASLVYRWLGNWILSLIVSVILGICLLFLIPVLARKKKPYAYAKSAFYFSIDNKRRPSPGLDNQEIVDHFDSEEDEASQSSSTTVDIIREESADGSLSHTPKNRHGERDSLWKFFCLCGWLKDIIRPFTHKNFTLIVLVRAGMFLSVATTQTYALYFLEDMFEHSYTLFGFKIVSSASQAFGVFSIVLLLSSGISSVVSGWLCDRYYEKRFYIFASCIVSAMALVVIVFTHTYTIMLIGGLIGGMAVGTFIAVDMALANEVIPNKDEASKDLAIYAAARTIPMLVGTPLSGLLLQGCKILVRDKIIAIPGFGYYIIYSLSALFCIASGITVLFINSKSTRREIHATLYLDLEERKTIEE